MQTLQDTLAWLCSIASVTGAEKEICDAVDLRLHEMGLSPRRLRNSLVVPVSAGAEGTEHIVLAGHFDTVAGEQDGPVRTAGDRLYGVGASDMKSGLASMLHACANPALRMHRHRISAVFYSGEEGNHADNELELLLSCDSGLGDLTFAVCLEPTNNQVQLGCVGSLHARIIFEGASAHSARPWEGSNAIHKASGLLSRLELQEPEWVQVQGLRYASVTSATLVQGGTTRNVVPERCVVHVNHRFAPGVTVAQAKRSVMELIASDGRVDWVDEAPSAIPSGSNPMVKALLDAGATGVEAKQAWTDVARFSEHAIAAACFGPGLPEQAHQRNEWTSLPKLQQNQQILERWFDMLAGR